MSKALTPNQVLDRLQIDLIKYGLTYEDESDEDVSRRSIKRDGKEVARVTFVSASRLEIMLFAKWERFVIADLAEDVKDKTGAIYRIHKCY